MRRYKSEEDFMKKKLWGLLFSLLLVFLLTSCDEVLSVVTAGEDGKKVVNSYISVMGEKVMDETASIKTWQDIELFKNSDMDMDELLFKIINKKENLVVLGNKESAVELAFFDGGYKYTIFVSQESLNNAFKDM